MGGLKFSRLFTADKHDPYADVSWERRNAQIVDADGNVKFEQCDVEVPAFWSQTATDIVASKYFRGHLGTTLRETSVSQVIDRVVNTIVGWGVKQEYFADAETADVFHAELTYILIYQYAAFNSPVWFNFGVTDNPQGSACFITSVDDSMESIMQLARDEAMIFKNGSGSGVNISRLRATGEPLSEGGASSGPLSFLRGLDKFAGAINSGGKTRRAARMVIMDADHPDILDFIKSKVLEEEKAQVLIDAGYDGGIDGEVYTTVNFSNVNNSVRLPDNFMVAVQADEEWFLLPRKGNTGQAIIDCKARDVLRAIAQAAHACGDPGVQFSGNVNKWNTLADIGEIRASNPCNEFLGLDNSACNLASINLARFDHPHALPLTKRQCRRLSQQIVDILITAQDIMIGEISYPTPEIRENSIKYRPLGLGYSGLGAFLMRYGHAYDSDYARKKAAGLTAWITGLAYKQSARIAKIKGSFPAYLDCFGSMSKVLVQHKDAVKSYFDDSDLTTLWDGISLDSGIRNSQLTLLAPTGTISFMMDCATTGIEPCYSLVTYKNLAGGGTLRLVNSAVKLALEGLGYSKEEVVSVMSHVELRGMVEGSGIKAEHIPIFDCAAKPPSGERVISVDGHLKMMAAVQPFLSGGISKTVNVPNETTVDAIEKLYIDAWRMGLKSIAVYRDGSKVTQPLSTSAAKQSVVATSAEQYTGVRRKLADERVSLTHKFSVGGNEGYVTVGMYEDDTPGELFIRMAKAGSTINGLVDSCALAASIALQYGAPLDVLVAKYSYTRFEPSGFTTNPDIPVAKSILDYVFRWLEIKFAKKTDAIASPVVKPVSSGSVCTSCGGLTVRTGSCAVCANCGMSNGCS